MVSRQHSFKNVDHPTPQAFDHFLPWACTQLGVDATIVVTRSYQTQYQSVSGKEPKGKAKVKARAHTDSFSDVDLDRSDDVSPIFAGGISYLCKPVHVVTVYNETMDLVQIKFLKNRNIPRTVMKILGLLIPYHQKGLASIVINSGLNAEALYEISKFLPTSNITELCLDYNFMDEGNYHIVLNHKVLKHLSLAKCKINDEVVKNIAANLAAPRPASKSLSALNLATNKITDIGVTYLADMLRSNRQLSYLNLADNMITDDGADSIFSTLVEFDLTTKEAFDRNNRLMNYLRTKNELVKKTLKDLLCGDLDKKLGPRKKIGKQINPLSTKKKAEREPSLTVAVKSCPNIETHYFERAEHIAEGIMGPFKDPFGSDNTKRRDNGLYCFGNNTLAYLNLAYNNLTYASLKKLCEVLTTQSILSRKPRGIVNVRLEGNYLPDKCPELSQIDEILKAELPLQKRSSEISRKRASSKKIY